MTERAGSLAGLRVVTVGTGRAVDLAAMFLGDHGADVVKVEPPGGDPARALPGWRVWNRGKRSAELDTTTASGVEQLRTLLLAADVAFDGLGDGALDRSSLGWESLHAANPGLILCRITGYAGLTSHTGRPVAESLVAARTGQQWEQRGYVGGPIEHILGRPGPHADLDVPAGIEQGADRGGPIHLASPFGGTAAAFLAALGVNTALLNRERTGAGQVVDTSLLQGFMAVNQGGWQRPEHPDAAGYWMWVLDQRSPKGLFECADGRWVHQWPMNPAAVMDAAETGDLTSVTTRNRDDERRLGMGPEDLIVLHYYYPQLVEAFRKYSSQEWVDLGRRIDVGSQPVRSPREALLDPALLEDGCVVSVDDPDHGSIRHVGVSYQLSKTPGAVHGPAPRLGAHTEAVLAEAAARPATTFPAKDVPRRAALEGIRVLDLGLGVAGPYGTQLLADLGAEVIKVNALHDSFWLSTHIGVSASRGKRSIAVNLKDERGRRLIQRLAQTSDVVAHNMRGGAAERLGVDYATITAANPTVVYCHSRGFDRGPRLTLPGTDQTAAALAGPEWEDGGCDRGGRPFWSPTNLGDTGNGFLCAIGIVQALYHRARTGQGQEVDTAILNASLLVAASTWVGADGTEPERPRLDAEQLGFDALNGLYQTADGWVCVAADPSQAAELLAALGIGELFRDARFADPGSRSRNDAGLAEAIAAALVDRTAEDAQRALDAAGVPCEISSSTFSREFFDDPELRARELVVTMRHPVLGAFDQPGHLVELSETPGRLDRPAPLCGQHTREILGELGLEDDAIAELLRDGVVRAADV